MNRQPPWIARAIVALLCPRSCRDEILGDLDELYARRRDRVGDAAAGRRYVRDAVSLIRLQPARHASVPTPNAVRGDSGMQQLANDMIYGLRTLRRDWGFTAVAVVTLALGIGANAAIFSVVHAVVLRPLPYPQPDRLVRVFDANPELGSGVHPVSPANYRDWIDRSETFDGLAAHYETDVTLTGSGEAERVRAGVVTASLFPLLGVSPAIGRTFAEGEDQPGGAPAVILSYGLWERRFAADPDLRGKRLIVDGEPRDVVGVMARRYSAQGIDCWLPLVIDPANPGPRHAHYLRVVGRLPGGVSIASAEAAMDGLVRGLETEVEALAGWDVTVRPLRDVVIGDTDRALWVLWAAVGFVVLIACANVANLLLARGAVRRREIAVRSALGAGRWRVLRLLLVENALLALAGAGLGILFAWRGLPLLVALAGGTLPRADAIRIDGTVLAFTTGLACLTALVFGLVPALQAAGADPGKELKADGRGLVSPRSGRLRGLLVMGEVALALILLAGAGLMVKTLGSLGRVDTGFRSDDLLTFRVQLAGARYDEPERVRAWYADLLERLPASGAVDEAAAISLLPMTGSLYAGFWVVGTPDDAEPTSALYRSASPGYFRTMGIPLRAGRPLEPTDGADAPPVLVVNEAFVRRYLDGRDPVGERIVIDVERRIVGVVGDVHHLGLDTQPVPAMYLPLAQDPSRSMAIVARVSGNRAAVVPRIRDEVRRLDADVPLYAVRTMNDVIGSSADERRFATTLLTIFAGLAIVLAIGGIYGVVSYATSQRRREIGVRMALGACRRDVVREVLGQGLRMAAVGLLFGIAGSFMLTRFLGALLFGVSPTDPVTFVAVAGFLLVAAAIASWLPALRAAAVDPLEALRGD